MYTFHTGWPSIGHVVLLLHVHRVGPLARHVPRGKVRVGLAARNVRDLLLVRGDRHLADLRLLVSVAVRLGSGSRRESRPFPS